MLVRQHGLDAGENFVELPGILAGGVVQNAVMVDVAIGRIQGVPRIDVAKEKGRCDARSVLQVLVVRRTDPVRFQRVAQRVSGWLSGSSPSKMAARMLGETGPSDGNVMLCEGPALDRIVGAIIAGVASGGGLAPR